MCADRESEQDFYSPFSVWVVIKVGVMDGIAFAGVLKSMNL
jgi:hypothetical protein